MLNLGALSDNLALTDLKLRIKFFFFLRDPCSLVLFIAYPGFRLNLFSQIYPQRLVRLIDFLILGQLWQKLGST